MKCSCYLQSIITINNDLYISVCDVVGLHAEWSIGDGEAAMADADVFCIRRGSVKDILQKFGIVSKGLTHAAIVQQAAITPKAVESSSNDVDNTNQATTQSLDNKNSDTNQEYIPAFLRHSEEVPPVDENDPILLSRLLNALSAEWKEFIEKKVSYNL